MSSDIKCEELVRLETMPFFSEGFSEEDYGFED